MKPEIIKNKLGLKVFYELHAGIKGGPTKSFLKRKMKLNYSFIISISTVWESPKQI